ncbi:5-carboxymethyl-2-hydroxymuconate isomerase [Salinihabitans flavidus]|uniref:5-carboxymethyl-2-hydroxymuconate isomerase n=1 Tax=Salinihabitans flavidus TaxID=569882 RepID=A0A1H8SSD0_9RHOB|nr:5-carboxymethyl-2-hydroxymuconate Delta-isomerase [Salinihabitans flavidus]SEO81602.1 5-carboxymethyl-2-hydroxymuconate isomerase [Salinihabitans flavidus]
MPHIIIDYSANLEDEVDMTAFCEHMRRAAATIESFPLAGIRVRAIRADHYAIADGNRDHGYIDISVRLRAGRPDAVKQAATQTLFDAARALLAPVLDRRPLALSLEMRDIDPDLSPKTGTIRQYLKES